MPSENIISITGVKHSPNVRFQLSSIVDMPVVLSEPIAKNTAPAIVLASKYISDTTNSDPVILVVPSDHMIKDTEAFAQTVKEGEKLAEQGYIVTFGIKPTYPETGYGYVNISDTKLEAGYKVKRFVEKHQRIIFARKMRGRKRQVQIVACIHTCSFNGLYEVFEIFYHFGRHFFERKIDRYVGYIKRVVAVFINYLLHGSATDSIYQCGYKFICALLNGSFFCQ
jgi:hypothetical protein